MHTLLPIIYNTRQMLSGRVGSVQIIRGRNSIENHSEVNEKTEQYGEEYNKKAQHTAKHASITSAVIRKER